MNRKSTYGLLACLCSLTFFGNVAWSHPRQITVSVAPARPAVLEDVVISVVAPDTGSETPTYSWDLSGPSGAVYQQEASGASLHVVAKTAGLYGGRVTVCQTRATNGAQPCHSRTFRFSVRRGLGDLRMIGEGPDALSMVRLSGSRSEMGYWYGRLLADQVAAVWMRFKAWLDATGMPPEQMDAIVGLMWNSSFFDTAAWDAEIEGIAQGCSDAGHPEITAKVLRQMELLPDISEYNCTLLAAWGHATKRGDLYQIRNLDWTMELGVQAYPVVAVYEPEDGRRHAVVGFAGHIGAAVGGMNEDGLAVSEIMGYFGDQETLAGIPYPVLLRDLLYHDGTLDEALARMRAAVRTNQYYYAVADPRAPAAQARLLLTSHSRFDEFDDAHAVDPHPGIAPSPFHRPIEDVVYWKNHDGSGNQLLFDAIGARYAAIDAERAKEIAAAAGVSTTVASLVYHNSERDFWVAIAEGREPATSRPYVHVRPFCQR